MFGEGSTLLSALVVVLVLIIAFKYRCSNTGNSDGNETVVGNPGQHLWRGVNNTGVSYINMSGVDKSLVDPNQQYGHPHNPYTVLHKQLDISRGVRGDGYNQPGPINMGNQVTHNPYGRNYSAEDLSKTEMGAWFANTDTGAATDVMLMAQSGSGSMGAENKSNFESFDSGTEDFTDPRADYGSYVTNLIVDPRTQDNHSKWVDEMKPWSGTARKVDTLEVENYVDFRGLRRPQAVVQHNPMMLTEVDSHDLSKHNKFNFQG